MAFVLASPSTRPSLTFANNSACSIGSLKLRRSAPLARPRPPRTNPPLPPPPLVPHPPAPLRTIPQRMGKRSCRIAKGVACHHRRKRDLLRTQGKSLHTSTRSRPTQTPHTYIHIHTIEHLFTHLYVQFTPLFDAVSYVTEPH